MVPLSALETRMGGVARLGRGAAAHGRLRRAAGSRGGSSLHGLLPCAPDMTAEDTPRVRSNRAGVSREAY